MNFKENFVRALAVKNIAGNGSQLTEGGFLANLVDAAFC